MQWTSGRNKGFSAAAKSKLYLPIDKRASAPDVATSRGKKNSLLNRVKGLCDLRVANEVLGAGGDFVPLYAKPRKYPFVYMRKSRGEKYIIALNPAGRAVKAEFAVKGMKSAMEQLAGSKCDVTIESGRAGIVMPAVSYAIYKAG